MKAIALLKRKDAMSFEEFADMQMEVGLRT